MRNFAKLALNIENTKKTRQHTTNVATITPMARTKRHPRDDVICCTRLRFYGYISAKSQRKWKEINKSVKKRNAFACFKEQTAGAHKLANHNTNAQVPVNI